jgi:hypothetical protein
MALYQASGANSAWASDTAFGATNLFWYSATASLITARTVSAVISRSVTASAMFPTGCLTP